MLDSLMNNLDGVLASKTFGLWKLELTHMSLKTLNSWDHVLYF
jgi:hypothetical protein